MQELVNQSPMIAAKRPQIRQSSSIKQGSKLLLFFVLLGLVQDYMYSSKYYLAIRSSSIYETDDRNTMGNPITTISVPEEHPIDNPMHAAYIPEDRATGNRSDEKRVPKDNTTGYRTKATYLPIRDRATGNRRDARNVAYIGRIRAIGDQTDATSFPQDHTRDNQTNATLFHDDTGSDGKFVFPLPPSQWLDDIDTSNPRCGAFKCAYDSKTNKHLGNDRRDDPNRYGYLVSQKIKSAYNFESTVNAYWKAERLADKFSIAHSLLARPQMFNATAAVMETLNENATHSVPKKDKVAKEALQFHKKRDRDELFVQPIQLVPEGSILFGCLQKYNSGMGRENLSEAIVNRTSLLPVEELQKFEERLRHDLIATVKMLKSKEGRCMASQFQVFIDPNTGRFYHIDTERCFDGNENRIPKKFLCYKKLVEYADLLLLSKGGSKLRKLPKIAW